jgi:hypothetical protein
VHRDLEDVLFAFAEDAPAPGAAEAGGAAADDQQHGVRKRGKGRTEAAHPTDTSDMAPMSPGCGTSPEISVRGGACEGGHARMSTGSCRRVAPASCIPTVLTSPLYLAAAPAQQEPG